MKNEDEDDVKSEVEKAKQAQRRWSKGARLLDYKDFAPFMKDDLKGEEFCQLMDQKGFIVSSRPMGDR